MGTSFEGMGKMKGGRGMFNAFSGFGKGITGSVGAVRIGIALALLVSVALAMFMLSSPAKAVKSGGSGNTDTDDSEPLMVDVITNGVRVSSNSIKFIFVNPYEFVDSFSVKCKESDGSEIDIDRYRLYRLGYDRGFKIDRVGSGVPGKGAYYLIITQPSRKGGHEKCWADIVSNAKTEYSRKIKRGEKWLFNVIPGYNVMSDCDLRAYELEISNKGKFSLKRVKIGDSNMVKLENLENGKVYYLINTKDECSFALVPENSVVEFCQSLMNRGVCEEATYILPDYQARCMGEGGNVCIMPFTTQINDEDTMWGCCK